MVCPKVPDAYLSVHSLYYLTPQEVLELVHRSKKHCLIAVVHRFENLYGGMHDNGDFVESHYETFVSGRDLLVNMKVTGNATSYVHSPCHWLNSTYFQYGQRAICWNGRPFGDSWIFEFTTVPLSCVGKISIDRELPMSLVSSLRRSDHYGNVSGVLSLGDESSFKPMLEVLNLSVRSIKSFGSFMWLSNPTDATILIPKGVIETVALKMVGVPRDKAGLRLCIQTMRNTVRPEKMSMPNSMRLNCCIYGSALAFVYSLNDEITVFNRLCSPMYKRLYSNLASVMSLEGVDILSWFICGKFADDNITVNSYNDSRDSVPGPTFDAKLAWPEGLPGVESSRPLSEIRVGSKLRHGDRTEIEDKPQFHAVATTFSEYIPVVPYSSINNETVSLVNRALMRVGDVDKEFWQQLINVAATETTRVFSVIDNVDEEKDFHAWNATFPAGRQKNQLLAWEDLKANPLNVNDFQRKAFVKRELTMKGGPVYEAFDPRAIQASSDRLNVAGGPFMQQVATQLKKAWNDNHQIFYTSGANAEEIGLWRAKFEDRDVTIVEMDESRYDAHQGEGCFEMFNNVLKQCGSCSYGSVDKANESMRHIYGYSSHGVRYEVNYTMTSGAWSTSTSNSFTNGMKTKFILDLYQQFFDNPIEYKMLVHGDDNLVVIEGRLTESQVERLKHFLRTMNARLGFDTKIKASYAWEHVEYCSSLFWPVEGGYVLGPKVGKRLPKFGFSLRDLDKEEVKGMMLGGNIECSYIPVLGEYVRHHLKLLKTSKKREFKDSRAVYKSLVTKRHVANESTEAFFAERYGVSASEAESELRKVMTNCLTACVSYPLLHLFVAADL